MATVPVNFTATEQLSPLFDQLSLQGPAAASPSNGGASPIPLEDLEVTSLDDTRVLSEEIGRLLNQIYEIQELRHLSEHSSAPTISKHQEIPLSKIDTLLSSLDESVASLASRISTPPTQASQNDVAGGHAADEAQRDWERVIEQHAMLKEEMKEDGWLIRYRTTADQAEAMMDPLEKSFADLSRYVARITASPVHVPFEVELEDQLSIRQLQSLAKGHEAMKRTYVPSIAKILKMMDKSISERSAKNGEALRRSGDMHQRWTALQRQLQQLDARVRLIVSQHASQLNSPGGEVEVLVDDTSTCDFGAAEDFAYSKAGFASSKQTPTSQRSSVSSGNNAVPVVRQSASTLSPETASRPELRRRASIVSNASASKAPAEKPRWNASPKLVPGTTPTPTSSRFSTSGRYSRATSPTPSSAPSTSSIMSRPGAMESRIPVLSPKSKLAWEKRAKDATLNLKGYANVPALAVSTSHGQTFLSEPGVRERNLDRARESMKTPEPRRSRPSGAYSATQPRSSMASTTGNRSLSATTPRASRARQSLPRAPPSAFRPTSPTPIGAGARPSSRLSMASYSNFNAASLQRFVPSKYDLLDQHVQTIIETVAFDLFVARVDASMKKGQRRRDDEEWKGDFVFGAGQKPTSVKLLQLAGRTGTGEAPRVKCLAKSAGAWQDLAGLLSTRKVAALESGLGSP